MTQLKKSKKFAKPSPAMAIILTFFVLLSIGLGVVAYFGYKDKDELRKKAEEANKATTGQEKAAQYYQFLAWDFALAAGRPLDPKFAPKYKIRREDFLAFHKAKGLKEFGGKEDYSTAPDYYNPWDLAVVEDNRDKLAYIEKEEKYIKNYKVLYEAEAKKLTDKEAAYKNRIATLEKEKIEYDTVLKSEDVYWKKVLVRLEEEFKKSGTALEAASATFESLRKEVEEAKEQAKKNKEAGDVEVEKFAKKIVDLNRELKTALSDRSDGGVGGGGAGKDIHALVLDISGFRPLWDRPLGKITALDLPNRLVYVQRNSRNVAFPFKTGLTFMVFAAGADEGAAGVLKGSLEVTRLVSEDTYACRITTFHDVERGEVNLADPAKLLGVRTAKNAFKEGDLIFNVFFGTRVALAGVYDLNGEPASSPVEMKRQLDATLASLERKGVKVDAYIDPVTGTVKGDGITSKTRFLIRGDGLDISAKAEAPKPMPPKEGKEEEKKEEVPGGDRARALEESLAGMRQKAIENGLFIISRSNFNLVTGHFPPLHFGETARLRITPGLPGATTLATSSYTFIARDEPKLPEFIGDWAGAGWELSIAKEGKAKVNFVTDRSGVPEVRLAPAEFTLRDGKFTLNVVGPTPLELNATLSVGGGALQLEDLTGKMSPKRITLKKR